MKQIALIATILGTIVFFPACEDDINERINTNPDARNIRVKYNAYIDDEVISVDSFYTNAFGEEFQIQYFNFLVSNFRYIRTSGDTITMENDNFSRFTMDDKETPIAHLPRGNYSGSFFIDLGMNDSLHAYYDLDTGKASPEFLREPGIHQGGVGFIALEVRGVVRNPVAPDSLPSQPFEMKIGGPGHIWTLESEGNFSISNDSRAIFILDADITNVFNIYPLYSEDENAPYAISDTNDLPSFNLAEQVQGAIEFSFR